MAAGTLYRRQVLRALSCCWMGCWMACLLLACADRKERVAAHVAVAANFTEAAKEISRLFEQRTGFETLLSFGSTGQLFTQITQDAPFEVFLAADDTTPEKAVAAGLGMADSVFTYAVGRIALFSKTIDLTDGEAALRSGAFQKIAIANPVTAPYGAAAVEALEALGIHAQLAARIVQGNNIAQTFQFVETGNAEIGFVALSQVIGKEGRSVWIVPQDLYSPLRQDAVLLKKGSENRAARAFISFLKSKDAVSILEKYGYDGLAR